jgi:type III restriction enzyme
MCGRGPVSETEVLWGLERHRRDDNVAPEALGAWLYDALRYLREDRGFTADELAYRKFRLREALADHLRKAKRNATSQRFLALIGDEAHLTVDGALNREFSQGRYAWDWQYNGFVTLQRHFFPQIGNLKSEGEEFKCAQFIANEMEGVRDWMRNVERKAGSFSLPTSSDRFYPDFLIRLENGGIIAAEYKGSHIADGKDSDEKKRMGELWERRSNGRCAFAWMEVADIGDWTSLKRAAERCGGA